MPCCKAEEYDEWCSEHEIVYTDKNGNKYCVFHAPQEMGSKPDNFNLMIIKKIQEAIDEKRECNLSGTIFPYPIKIFKFKDNPLPEISFENATFSRAASFFDATFSGKVNFYNATFSEYADFYNANFIKEADFSSATFSEDAIFYNATFSGKANFNSAIFKEKADFVETTFSDFTDFSIAIFNEPALFNCATFSSNTNFTIAKFVDEAMFINAKFKQRSSFRNCKVDHRMYFENVDLSSVSFLDTDIKNMTFQGCTWLKKKNYGRHSVTDELDLKDKKSENKLLAYEKVEDLYRKLKHKYKAENNEPEVSNWHYGEKEMFRKKYWWRRYIPFSISNLYWFSSGYGERPVRSGLILISVLLGVSVVSGVLGLVPNGNKSVSNILWIHGLPWSLSMKQLGFLIYNTFQNALFIKEPLFIPSSISGKIFLDLCTKIIIPIQTALFVLSVRNQFRR